jgi:hypothetical protein
LVRCCATRERGQPQLTIAPPCSVPLCYVYPAMLHYKACARTWKEKAADIALGVFGVVAAIYTTAQTVYVSVLDFNSPSVDHLILSSIAYGATGCPSRTHWELWDLMNLNFRVSGYNSVNVRITLKTSNCAKYSQSHGVAVVFLKCFPCDKQSPPSQTGAPYSDITGPPGLSGVTIFALFFSNKLPSCQTRISSSSR